MFRRGREESERNRSSPIPYLDVPAEIPDIDPTDNSACLPRCERRKKTNVALGEVSGVSREPSRRRTRYRQPYRSKETLSRLQECSWQVWLLVGFGVSYERALRRTSFKVQTVKAGHPQKVHDSIMYFLRLISDFSTRARFREARRASLSPRGDLVSPYRGLSRYAP